MYRYWKGTFSSTFPVWYSTPVTNIAYYEQLHNTWQSLWMDETSRITVITMYKATQLIPTAGTLVRVHVVYVACVHLVIAHSHIRGVSEFTGGKSCVRRKHIPLVAHFRRANNIVCVVHVRACTRTCSSIIGPKPGIFSTFCFRSRTVATTVATGIYQFLAPIHEHTSPFVMLTPK